MQWLLADVLARYRAGYTSPLAIAEIYARLGRPDEMFYWLDEAFAERSSRLCASRTSPWFQRWLSTGRF